MVTTFCELIWLYNSCCMIYVLHTKTLLNYILIINLHYILLKIQFFMNTLNILKLIVIIRDHIKTGDIELQKAASRV